MTAGRVGGVPSVVRPVGGSAAVGGIVSVELTRSELVALKEWIELTPLFEGRSEARNAIREVLRERRPSPLRLDESIVACVIQRMVPTDLQTAALRSKLTRGLQRDHEPGESGVEIGLRLQS
jgi:hypothetical protein